MSGFACKAAELVKEVAAWDADQLLQYNVEGVNQVLKEVSEHYQQMQEALRLVQESGVGWDRADITEAASVLLHHQALLRNKRCLMAYIHERMWRIRRMRWQLGAVLPSGLQENLSNSEKEYFRSYSESLGQYMMAVDTDITVDLTPPKDPYIEVRVLKDAGTLVMDDKVTHLEPNTVHLIRRSDAELLIMKGLLEHRQY